MSTCDRASGTGQLANSELLEELAYRVVWVMQTQVNRLRQGAEPHVLL